MTTCDSTSILQLQHISSSYGKMPVLQDISFSLDSSRPMVGLLGPNGCGKTTLLNVICNHQPHDGSCCHNQHPLESCSIRQLSRIISYIPQRTGIYISMSVLDVVLSGFNPRLGLFQQPDSAMQEAALHALEAVGISQQSDQDFLTLSEGQKQLCILARTLIEDTPLLLLDEPDSALDFGNKYSMMSMIQKLVCTSGKLAVLCLHDPMLALDFCDQLVIMKQGRILATVYPKTDSVTDIEHAFSLLYDYVALQELIDRNGRRRLVLLSELT